MKKQVLLVISLLFLAAQSSEYRNLENSDDDLLFVVELFRHGARGPVHEYWDYKDQEDMIGELTSVGMHQHYLLGKQMRKEFVTERQFLSETYSRKEMEAYSSNVNRTIQSAYSHLYGFYPLETGPLLPESMKLEHIMPPYPDVEPDTDYEGFALKKGFNTIPVHQSTQETFIFSEKCPNKQNFIDDYQKNHPELENYVWEKYGQELAKKLSDMLGTPINSLEEIRQVMDNFYSNLYQNRPLPSELSNDDLELMKFIYSFRWINKNQGKVNKVMSTELLNFVKQNFYEKIQVQDPDFSVEGNDYMEGMQRKKWIVLSGHDSNVVQVMVGLGLTSPQCIIDAWENNTETDYNNCLQAPPYASQILFELYKGSEEGKYNVKLRYNGVYVNLCGEKSETCDYDKFKQQIESYVSKNPWEECGFQRIKQWATPKQFKQYNLTERWGGQTKEIYLKSDPHYVLVFLVIGFGLLALVLGIIWGKMYITERKLRGTLLRGESDRWHEMA